MINNKIERKKNQIHKNWIWNKSSIGDGIIGKQSYVMTVGADRPVNSCIFDSFNATSTCKNQDIKQLVLINMTKIKWITINIIKISENWPEEREHPENHARSLQRPSRTVQCKAWSLLLLSQFPTDGTPSDKRNKTTPD